MALIVAGFGQDEQYKIGIDDRLSVSFWQEPDLDTEIRVREDGTITLPVIGDIKAAGYTTSEFAKMIVKQIDFYNPGISQATVIVTEYNSQTVVLTGAVYTPGEYHFEKIPNLLDIISRAGGALPTADLSSVTIIRQVDGKVKIIRADILEYLRDGDLTDLPSLQAKDLINIPQSTYGVAAEALGGQAFKGKNIYFIYGAVNQPGVKTLSEDIELTDAIAAAGGITGDADVKNVRVVLKDIRYSSVLHFNLDEYSMTGRPARYRLHQEDTIIIPYRPPPSFWSRLPEMIVPATVTAIITTILVDMLTNTSGE